MIMHKVTESVWIGTYFALQGRQSLEKEGITHVLSVMSPPIDEKYIQGFTHKVIDADDEEDQDILQFFDEAIQFISLAVKDGCVLVHCVSGISRSPTIVAAFLMKKHHLSRNDALELVRRGRTVASPNPGFLEQLQVFEDCQCDISANSTPYRRWKLRKDASFSASTGVAPVVRFYNKDMADKRTDNSLKCRKCRRPLAPSNTLLDHHRPQASGTCSHYFVEPLQWMKTELDKGMLEGKFSCPKCGSKVGSFAWQGMKCSCKSWVTPALSLQKSKTEL